MREGGRSIFFGEGVGFILLFCIIIVDFVLENNWFLLKLNIYKFFFWLDLCFFGFLYLWLNFFFGSFICNFFLFFDKDFFFGELNFLIYLLNVWIFIGVVFLGFFIGVLVICNRWIFFFKVFRLDWIFLFCSFFSSVEIEILGKIGEDVGVGLYELLLEWMELEICLK